MLRSGGFLLLPFFLPPIIDRTTIHSDTFIYRNFRKDKKKNNPPWKIKIHTVFLARYEHCLSTGYFRWVLVSILLTISQSFGKYAAGTLEKWNQQIVPCTRASRTDLPSWKGSNSLGEGWKRRTDSDGTWRWGTLRSEISSPPGKTAQLRLNEPNHTAPAPGGGVRVGDREKDVLGRGGEPGENSAAIQGSWEEAPLLLESLCPHPLS